MFLAVVGCAELEMTVAPGFHQRPLISPPRLLMFLNLVLTIGSAYCQERDRCFATSIVWHQLEGLSCATWQPP